MYTIAGEICIYKDGKKLMTLDCPKKKPIPISGDEVTTILKWASVPPNPPRKDLN